jgi:hypothetical protein
MQDAANDKMLLLARDDAVSRKRWMAARMW